MRLRDLAAPEDVWQLLHADLPATFPALRSLDATPNNLPQQLTSFVGREQEMAAVQELLRKTRLLTLTGSGGCGKTRLALQVAADLLDAFPDGVWLVELAALADPGLVPQTVAAIARAAGGARAGALTQTLVEHLASKRLLLVLDNCEHLLDACAQAGRRGAAAVSARRAVLSTSREALGIAGETTYRVPSLAAARPEARRHAGERIALRGGAPVRRARAVPPAAVRRHRRRTRRRSPASATGWTGFRWPSSWRRRGCASLSIEEINRRLDERFRLLTGGSRTALPRQQTLRALIDWSYDLLTDAERALFRRLAVFAGGWTLAAAEEVCAGEDIDEAAVLDLLTSLVDKSLVVAEERDGATRYRLLETVRQYARDRLLESGEGRPMARPAPGTFPRAGRGSRAAV